VVGCGLAWLACSIRWPGWPGCARPGGCGWPGASLPFWRSAWLAPSSSRSCPVRRGTVGRSAWRAYSAGVLDPARGRVWRLSMSRRCSARRARRCGAVEELPVLGVRLPLSRSA
jgi:hypothetical protein